MNKQPHRNMRTLIIERGEGAVPHRLYDLTIENVTERREKSLVLRSAIDAMSYLGVAHSTFYANKVTGKQIYSKKFEIAIITA